MVWTQPSPARYLQGPQHSHQPDPRRTPADLPAPELLDEVRQAYAEGLVDESVADLEGIERDLAASKPSCRERHTLITDAIGEMEHWACFHPEDSPPKRPPEVQVAMPPLSPAPPPAPATYETPKPLIR